MRIGALLTEAEDVVPAADAGLFGVLLIAAARKAQLREASAALSAATAPTTERDGTGSASVLV